jgi:hypothetical protein
MNCELNDATEMKDGLCEGLAFIFRLALGIPAGIYSGFFFVFLWFGFRKFKNGEKEATAVAGNGFGKIPQQSVAPQQQYELQQMNAPAQQQYAPPQQQYAPEKQYAPQQQQNTVEVGP